MRDAATHWRDASRNPKFFMLEAPAAFPLVIFLLHIRWWSFFLAIGATLFFGVLSHFKFTIPVFKRWILSILAGPIRHAYPWWRQ